MATPPHGGHGTPLRVRQPQGPLRPAPRPGSGSACGEAAGAFSPAQRIGLAAMMHPQRGTLVGRPSANKPAPSVTRSTGPHARDPRAHACARSLARRRGTVAGQWGSPQASGIAARSEVGSAQTRRSAQSLPSACVSGVCAGHGVGEGHFFRLAKILVPRRCPLLATSVRRGKVGCEAGRLGARRGAVKERVPRPEGGPPPSGRPAWEPDTVDTCENVICAGHVIGAGNAIGAVHATGAISMDARCAIGAGDGVGAGHAVGVGHGVDTGYMVGVDRLALAASRWLTIVLLAAACNVLLAGFGAYTLPPLAVGHWPPTISHILLAPPASGLRQLSADY